MDTKPMQTASPGAGPEPVRRLDGPVLLLGASGMLGTAWRRLLTGAGVGHASPSRAECDITKPAHVKRWLRSGFRTVINCAAWTDVDGAEQDERGATKLNADAPAHVATECAHTGACFVHYSTDYVFDGSGARPYRIGDRAFPRTVYGRTKLDGELRVAQSGARHLIIRTSWLYAPWGSNFVLTMRRLLGERLEVRVVDDQRGRPTSAEHLVRTSAGLLALGAEGIHHVCDAGECSWHALATEIGRMSGLDARVIACTSAEFPRPAPRPAYSVLDLSRTVDLVGSLPSWQENLRSVLDALERQPEARRQGAA